MIRIVLSVFCLLTPAAVYAASANGEPPHIGHLFWYFINFLLYVGFIYLIGRKPFKSFWQRRREKISAAVNKGEQEMQAAKADLMLATEKLSTLTPEYLAGVVSEIENNSKEEAKKILESAEMDIEQLKKQASQSIAAERSKSTSSVRQAVAEEVITKATAKVKQSYTDEIDKQRRDQALRGTGSLV